MEDADAAGARYTRGAIALHWAIAGLILLNIAAAWIAEDLPRAEHDQIMGNHMAIGLTILVLSVLRILWRIVHPAPPFVATLRAWEAALARVVHTLFYVLIVAIPLTGWAMVSSASGGGPIGFFGLFALPGLPFSRDRDRAELIGEVHETLAILAILLLVVHVAAALKHQFVDRDATLARMIPWLR
jgi:cytochrome b561